MIWFVIYLLAVTIFYCLFIASGSEHETALLTACVWPVVLIIMIGALIAGVLIGLIKLIKDKVEKKQ